MEVVRATRVQFGKHVVVGLDDGIILDITGPQLGLQARAGLDAEEATDVALALLAAVRSIREGKT